MAAKVIERLVAELGFKVDANGLDKFKNGIESTKSSLLKAKLVITGFVASMLALPKSAANVGESLDKLLNKLNASSQGYHNLEGAVNAYGESVESLNSTLETLKKKSQDVYYGDAGAIKGFTLLGISAKDLNGKLKNTDDLLLDISDRLSKIKNASLRRHILGQLGIGEDFAENFLKLGSEKIKAFSQRSSAAGYLFSEKDRKAAREFNQELRISLSFFKGIKNELGAKLYPEYVKIVKKANDFFIANRRWISLGVEKIAATISGVFNGLAITMKGVINGAKGIFNIFREYPVLLAAFIPFTKKIISALALVFTKVRLIAIGIAGALLLVEDLYHYFKGDKLTFTADFIKGFKEAIPIVKVLLTGLFDWIRSQIYSLFTELPNPAKTGIKYVANKGKEAAAESFQFLKDSGLIDSAKKILKNEYNNIKGIFGLGGGEGNNVTQNNNINIVTTTKEAAEFVKDSIEKSTDELNKYIRDNLDTPKVI